MLEIKIAQEYTGQQIDVCYLVPMWKEVLDFSTGCGKPEDTVADIISAALRTAKMRYGSSSQHRKGCQLDRP